MIKELLARRRQGHRTMGYPREPAVLPELFRGYPRLSPELCPSDCDLCVAACPVGAVTRHGSLALDLGKCTFCPHCDQGCPHNAISFTADPRLATRRREELLLTAGEERRLAEPLGKELLRLFGRSLKLREVSAGGCNACEADTNVLSTIGFDLGRFGIQFVASPRHADALFVTGPVTENMREALLKTHGAIPSPKLVIACGSCAISGGPFRGSPEVHNGVDAFLPVDLYIPGCPPHPVTILDGLLRTLGKMP